MTLVFTTIAHTSWSTNPSQCLVDVSSKQSFAGQMEQQIVMIHREVSKFRWKRKAEERSRRLHQVFLRGDNIITVIPVLHDVERLWPQLMEQWQTAGLPQAALPRPASLGGVKFKLPTPLPLPPPPLPATHPPAMIPLPPRLQPPVLPNRNPPSSLHMLPPVPPPAAPVMHSLGGLPMPHAHPSPGGSVATAQMQPVRPYGPQGERSAWTNQRR